MLSYFHAFSQEKANVLLQQNIYTVKPGELVQINELKKNESIHVYLTKEKVENYAHIIVGLGDGLYRVLFCNFKTEEEEPTLAGTLPIYFYQNASFLFPLQEDKLSYLIYYTLKGKN